MPREKKKIQDIFFITCRSCRGRGCSNCRQRGFFAWTNGHFLYFKGGLNTNFVYRNRARRQVNLIINVFLLAFGILGGLIFLLLSLSKGPSAILEKSVPSFLFWLSAVLDLYFYYRLKKETLTISKIKKLVKKQGEIPYSKPFSYQDVAALETPLKFNLEEVLTSSSREAVEGAFFFGRKLKAGEILPIHLLFQLIYNSSIRRMLRRLNVDFSLFNTKATRLLKATSDFSQKGLSFSLGFKKLVFKAYTYAFHLGEERVYPEDLFLAMIETSENLTQLFDELGFTIQKIRNVVAWIRFRRKLVALSRAFRVQALFKPKSTMNRALTARPTPILDSFSNDLTLLARAGLLFPLIDRERELENIITVLQRAEGNVLLIGEAGVGKTAIIEGLAQQMVIEDVPEILQDKRLVNLNIGKLAADPEAGLRLANIIDEIDKSGNIILVIEGIGNLMSTLAGGTGRESVDLAEILEPALRSPTVHVIGTAHPDEYAREIRLKTGFERRFQTLKIEEPETDDAIQILEAKSMLIEAAQKVFFSYDAIERAVKLSDEYIKGRFLPAKALDILEEVAVKVASSRRENRIVSGEDVAKLITAKTSIKVTKITEEESEKLLHLEEEIHKRLVDQDEAVKMVANALRRARAQFRDEERPIVNLLFLGPTGVGKTELAKQVARVYFGGEERVVRLDMSEYQDADSVGNLIGAPAGTGGGGGYLTEQVRQHPFTLLHLDEIEKAHPDILNLFLQVMEDGRLTDSRGHTVDFTNVILIGTSNAGTQFIQDGIKEGKPLQEIKEELMDSVLKDIFRPEFLNRFDGIIVFRPLTIKEVFEIAKIMIKELGDRLESKGIHVKATDEAVMELAEAGFDPKFGARPLRRVIQERVDNVIAREIVSGNLKRRDTVLLKPGGVVEIKKAERI